MATVIGGLGDELLAGTADADWLEGGDGNDTVLGEGGDDTLWGGYDNDLISCADGADVAYGNLAADTLWGDAGDDTLFGGQGDDLISAGDGADVVYGNMMSDWIDGGDGVDWVFGGQGNDTILGGAGDDWLCGNRGDDLTYGGAGNDWLLDGPGADTLYGGEGDDILECGDATSESNRAFGEAGNDGLAGGNAADTLDGGIGNDFMFGRGGSDLLYGGEGDDTIWTDDTVMTQRIQGDTVYGGEGDDLVIVNNIGGEMFIGGSIRGFIAGEGGNDTIDASGAPHSGEYPYHRYAIYGYEMEGGDGNDLLVGCDLQEDMAGGAGADTLSGGGGYDVLDGGAGNDVFHVTSALPPGAGPGWGPTLTGGADADLFVIGGGGLSDPTRTEPTVTITDFEDGIDRIDLAGFGGGTAQIVEAGGFRSVPGTIAYQPDADGTAALTAYVNGADGTLLAIRIVGVSALDATDIGFV